MNLFDVLRDDVKRRDAVLKVALHDVGNDDVVDVMTLKSVGDLERLREVAGDRVLWRRCF